MQIKGNSFDLFKQKLHKDRAPEKSFLSLLESLTIEHYQTKK